MKNAIALVVVLGGVAEAYAPKDTCVAIVDIDNIKAGDPKVELPSGIGFEELVEDAGIEEYVFFVSPENKNPS